MSDDDPDRPNILLIEDDALSRAVVRSALKDRCHLYEEFDGPSGLELLHRTPVDLVLLDIVMPGMTGFEVCEYIKARSQNDEYLPVLMLTALSSQDDRNAGLLAGADDFLKKPIDRQELMLRVDAFIRLRRQDQRIRRQNGERQVLEHQLQQARRLESIGRFAAGIAHEISTPTQFVRDSLCTVRQGVAELLRLLGLQRASSDPAAAGPATGSLARLLEGLPAALERSTRGIDRIADIVLAMTTFAHPTQKEMTDVDLNQAIIASLTIASFEYKYVADVETELGDLPSVRCHMGEINQVLVNLLVNAADAITEVVKSSGARGTITVRSHAEGGTAVVRISDTGAGIPEAVRGKVFDAFFTTKGPGKGTGQGLALARAVVVDKHGGALTFESVAGRGTTFTIRLPIQPAPSLVAQSSSQPAPTSARLT
jgi:signal transduction histidine kinase